MSINQVHSVRTEQHHGVCAEQHDGVGTERSMMVRGNVMVVVVVELML